MLLVSKLRTLALACLIEDADSQLRSELSCERLYEEQALIDRGLVAVAIAEEEYPELTDGVAVGLHDYLALFPQPAEAFGCELSQPHGGVARNHEALN